MRNLRHQWIIRIRICQHRADREQDFGDGERRRPLVTEDVQADAAIGVNVGVVYAGLEVDFGRLEGVVGGEMDAEEEDAVLVW